MYIGDLHIHSRYSRATSRDCTPEYLDLWARKKGIDIVGTGDFTHPAWREELKEKLEPAILLILPGGRSSRKNWSQPETAYILCAGNFVFRMLPTEKPVPILP